LAGLVAAVATAATAIAAEDGDGYRVPDAESPFPWMAMLYVVVALAGICVVGFKSSGRTHLD